VQVQFPILHNPLKYLIIVQTFRKLKDRLEYHGVDYHTAAAAAAAAAASNYAEATDFISEKVLQLLTSYCLIL
jgi:hypothetical protein